MLNDNDDITVESLVLNDSFRRWVLKDAPEEGAFWNAWVESNTDKVDLFLQAREMVLTMHAAQETISTDEVEKEISRLTHTLHMNREVSLIGKKQVVFTESKIWYKAAAVVLLLLVGGIAFWYPNRQDKSSDYVRLVKQVNVQLVEESSESNRSKLVNLSDGSTVILSPGSRISFPERFARDNREVYLQGEAFFEVTKNPEQPFLVHANGLISKVLGTSFTIRAFEHDSEVKVIVKTGKVSVFTEKDPAQSRVKEQPELTGLILTPNQQVVFNRNDNRMIRTLVEKPAVVNRHAIQQQAFNFTKTPVKEVFAILERTYGVNIIYNEDLIEGCELTGELGDEPLLEKMNLICKAIDGSYEMIDAQIVVNSKSCK